MCDKLILKTKTKIQEQLRFNSAAPPTPPDIKMSSKAVALIIMAVVSTQRQTSGRVARKGEPERNPCVERVNTAKRWSADHW